MNRPDYHPMADATIEFLISAFGPEAGNALSALQIVGGNTAFMQTIEAFCHVHDAPLLNDPEPLERREGRRSVALMIMSARTISPQQLKEALDGKSTN